MNYDSFEGLAQALFEESGDALFLFDPDSDAILEVNSQAQRLTGFSLWELRKMPLGEVFRSERQGGLQRVRQASRKTLVFHSQEGYFLRTLEPDIWIPVNVTVTRLHVKPKALGLITARDVRESYGALVGLRQTEAELRRVLASVPACVWSAEVDDAGKCVYRYFSPVVERITGRPPDFFLGGFNRWWSVIHPEDQPRWERAFVRLRAGESVQEEYRVLRPDESVRWVRDAATATHPAESSAVRLDGFLTDITEQKQAEEALRETQERFGAFMDNSPAVAFMRDREGRLVYVNQPFRRAFQKGEREVLGKTAFDLFPAPVARELVRRNEAVLAQGTPLQFVETIPSADGVLRQWLVHRFPFRDRSGQQYLGGVGLDITEQRRTEKLLQESEERFRDLLNCSNDLIQSAAPDGSLLFVNRAWRQTLGYGEDEIPRLSWLNLLHPDSRASNVALWKRVLAGERVERAEATFTTKDGRSICLEWSADCRLKDGQPLYACSVLRDVSTRKRLDGPESN